MGKTNERKIYLPEVFHAYHTENLGNCNGYCHLRFAGFSRHCVGRYVQVLFSQPLNLVSLYPFPFIHFPMPKKTKKIRDARVTMVAPEARSA